MEKLNREFFDEYTALDDICRLMLNSNKGVTGYIDRMVNTPRSKSQKVREWESDLKMLKQYRHIRNTLAHTVGAFHQNICVRYDITWIKNFQGRIKRRTDPLSLAVKAAQSKKGGKSRSGSKRNAKKRKAQRAFWIKFVVSFAIVSVLFLLIYFAVKG